MPQAEYAIYIDQILAGGFSTPLVFPFPGLEEFYSGAAESDNISSPDPVLSYASVSAPAGGTVSGVDIISIDRNRVNRFHSATTVHPSFHSPLTS